MKKNWLLAALLALCPPAMAADVNVAAGGVDVHVGAHSTPASHAAKPVRVSEILGLSVQNPEGESLGSIEDIVLDTSDGSVRYAAVSMGGFLGVGDKLFAVPWNSLECDKKDGEHVVVLDVTKESLENAQGFDQEHWPDMANPRWRMDNDRHYTTPVRPTSANGLNR